MSVLDDSSSPSDPNLPACPPSPDDRRILTHAGGAAFAVDNWTRLDRFLILGVTSGTYYVSSRDLLQSNTTAILLRRMDCAPSPGPSRSASQDEPPRTTQRSS